MSERRKRRVGHGIGLLAVGLLALVAWLTPSSARADDAPRGALAWDQLGLALHLDTSALLPHESWRPRERPAGTPQLQWLGSSPHVSFVARDWGVSQVLWGHLTIADQLRLSRSSRMVVTRLRLAGGRLAPFAQLGIGQWRIDTSVIATLPTDVELAGQLGGGFELEITPSAALALQGDCTFIFPEGREPQMLSSGHVWATLLAAKARF